MSDINTSGGLNQLTEDRNDIHSLYDKMMQGFEGTGIVMTSELNEDGNYHMLYAPGYEDMGVGDIVAECK